MPRRWMEKSGEEDQEQECDGRTALRETWKKWEENGKQQQKIGELKTGDKEHRKTKIRKEKTKKRWQ